MAVRPAPREDQRIASARPNGQAPVSVIIITPIDASDHRLIMLAEKFEPKLMIIGSDFDRRRIRRIAKSQLSRDGMLDLDVARIFARSQIW